MKAVMISIQPKWCELIANGKKTIEVRKTRPKIDMPFKCYIYAIKSKRDEIGHVVSYSFRSGIKFDVGKVIGEFICDRVEGISKVRLGSLGLGEFEDVQKSCLTEQQIYDYCQEKDVFYTWHITDLKIYDKPKEIGDFNHLNKCPSARQDEYDGTWYCEEVDGENAVVDKTKQFPYDEECIYFDCPSCGGENYENEEYAFCMCNGYKPFTKPPQSWQYCEELEDII